MKIYLLTLLLILNNKNLFSQLFEGKIIYKVEYLNSKTQQKDTKLEEEEGTEEEFFIKNGNYLIKSNGTKNEWKLYLSSTNLIYEKRRNNDTLYTYNAGINKDTILEINSYKSHSKNDTSGLREVVLHCNSGSQYFYYDKKYQMDQSLFSRHKVNNLNSYLRKSNSIPLTMVFETHNITYEKMSRGIEPQKLEYSIFAIPKNLIVKNK